MRLTSKLEVVDLTPRIGSEIRAPSEVLLSGDYATRIRSLLADRGVLVFKELHLDDEQQLAFTKTLGEMTLQKGREFMNISLDRKVNAEIAEYQRGTFFWHSDMMFWKVPQLASLLTARVLSPTGGETEFANTYAAWDDLPEHEKHEFENLQVVHSGETANLMWEPEPSLRQLEEWRRYTPSCAHPIVWTHQSGRKSLLVGATASYILDKSPEESRYILTKLRDWATQPQFVYQHRWSLGDLVIWDNTGTMHRARPYPIDCGRLMRRTALAGEEAIA